MQYFLQAIDKEPTYAPAYCGLSDSYRMLEFDFAVDPRESIPKTKAAAAKAIELDDSLAEAHIALAAATYRYEWNWARAEAEFKRALELNPNSSEAHREYAVFLKSIGRFDEALGESAHAQALDPLSSFVTQSLANVHYFWRRYDRAIELAGKELDTDPNLSQAHFLLGMAHGQSGNWQAGIRELEKAVELSGRNAVDLAFLGYAYAVSGQTGRARKILAESRPPAYGLALIYAGLGEREQAFAALEQAFRDRSFLLANLKVDPCFDSLRSDPRFHDLLRRIGL